MAKPIRRRISAYEVNRELQSPAFAASPREHRRAAVAILRVLDDVDIRPIRPSEVE